MTSETPKDHWDQVYRDKRKTSSGTPSAILVRVTADLPAGRSLDLGSSNGDDVIWLAGQGWDALGYDISSVACDRATARAADLGLSERARFAARDLSAGLPDGSYDLVTALFFQSKVDLPRRQILRQAANVVAPGGVLLVVSHAAPPPWSNMPADPDHFPTLEQELADLADVTRGWQEVEAQIVSRIGKSPEGEAVDLLDNVVLLRRPA